MSDGKRGLTRRQRTEVKVTTRIRPDLRRRSGWVFYFGYRNRDLFQGEPRQDAIPVDYGRWELSKVSRAGKPISVEWVEGLHYRLVYGVGVTPSSDSPFSGLMPFNGEAHLVFALSDGSRREIPSRR